jgi:hypothetical protein
MQSTSTTSFSSTPGTWWRAPEPNCSKAFGVLDEVEQSPVSLLDEYGGHPSIRKLVDQGFHVVTF